MYVCTCRSLEEGHMCMYAHIEARSLHWVAFKNHSPLYLLSQSLFPKAGVWQFSWTGWSTSPRDPSISTSPARISIPSFQWFGLVFNVGAGHELWSSCLHGKHCTDEAVSLTPSLPHFKRKELFISGLCPTNKNLTNVSRVPLIYHCPESLLPSCVD